LGITTVYVTHDQVEAMTMGDRIVVMRDGFIQQIGTPLSLYNQPVNRFVAGFIGSPPMNIMTATLKEEGGRMIADEGDFQLEIPPAMQDRLRSHVGKEILFGVRPEDLHYHEQPAKVNNIAATVNVIEPLGAEIHVYLATKNSEMIARVGPTVEMSVGDTVHLTPNMEKVHFFDIETEAAVGEYAMAQ
jgi:multiple sugar transport system ATP-binding protein